MTFSEAEMFLGLWAFVMTVLWVREKESFKTYRIITMMTYKRLSKKQIEVVDTGEHFEFKEIKS